ncbi:MAG: hypothetical protein WCJ39_09460 [bacterium]
MKEFNQLSRLLAKYLATEQEKYLDDFNAISAIQLPIEVLSPFLNQFEAEEAERLLKKKARDLADEEEKKRKAEKLKNSKQPNGEWYMNSSSWANI